MSFTPLANIPGFFPILEIISSPLPAFLITLSLTTIPFFVVNLSISAQYADLFRMLNSDIDSQIQRFTNLGSRSTAQNEFDFIVVGGGTAGSVIAARLSEKYHVLLIEAGGDPHPLTYVPYISTKLSNLPMINWQFKTEPLNNSGFAWPNQKMAWPSGRSLGGSSNSNNMIYMRGNPQDYNSWAQHAGDERWSYTNVEQIFKRIENYHGHWEGSAHHGEGGPMHIEKVKFQPSAKYWLDAGKEELGKRIVDMNSFQTEGFSPLDVFQKDGKRFSTFRGYIEPNLQNPNLTIHRYSVATKIHFDDAMRAVGVTYYRHANKRYASAKSEIIISCGAINTPNLLMNSGVGNKAHLEAMNIKPLVDLKVGENLQVHSTVIAGPFLLNKNVSFLRSRDLTPLSAAEYLSLGKGPLSSADGITATGLISSNRNQNKNWPDILLAHVGLGIDKNMGTDLEKVLGMKVNGGLSSFLEYNAKNDSNFVMVSVGKPKSRGYLKLVKNDGFESPSIFPNYLSDEGDEDLDVLIEGIQFAVKLYENTTTFAKLGGRLAPNHFPGCESHELKSRSYWKCYIRHNLLPHSPCGTCKMGKIEDPNSVVDSELRLIGTKGIRIADSSIMPFITNADLTAPQILIGEMCADLIKSMWPISETIMKQETGTVLINLTLAN